MLGSSPFCAFHNLGSFFQCVVCYSSQCFPLDFFLCSCLVNWATQAVGNLSPFLLCLEHRVALISQFPLPLLAPWSRSHRLWEWEGARCTQRQEVQRPGMMSKPSSGSLQSPGSSPLSLFRLFISSPTPAKGPVG